MQSQQPDDQGGGDRGSDERSAPQSRGGPMQWKLYEPPLPQLIDDAAPGLDILKPARQRMAERCQPLLPKERIGYIIYCQRRSPYTMALRPEVQPRVIAVTRDHVCIVQVGMTWMSVGLGVGVATFLAAPKGIIAKLPRDTRIGPVSGNLMWGRATVNGERVWIPRKYFKDVEAADTELTAT